MSNVVKIKSNIPVVSSLDLANGLSIKHRAIMEMIDKYNKKLQQIRTFTFETEKSGGRPTRFCYLDEEQSVFIVTLMKNSDVVVDFKYRLTRDFIRQRRLLMELSSQPQNSEWLELRKTGKVKRREETDVIKKFVNYAKNQGSLNAERYYSNISRMENKSLFFLDQKFKNIREILNLQQLSIVICADEIVSKALCEGMDKGMHYKDIFQIAKTRVESFAEIHGKTYIPCAMHALPEVKKSFDQNDKFAK